MILMAREIEDGLPDQTALGLLNATVRRNAFGRQVDSFVAPLQFKELGPEPFPAVFIRAPLARAWGPEVEVLAENEGQAVALRQGSRLATSFHPELSGDSRFHRWFLDSVVKTSCSCS
jgi:5'-phosphate synthase pdxT subunit